MQRSSKAMPLHPTNVDLSANRKIKLPQVSRGRGGVELERRWTELVDLHKRVKFIIGFLLCFDSMIHYLIFFSLFFLHFVTLPRF